MSTHFVDLADPIFEAALDGAENWADLVMADAQDNCPVDTGLMQSTGKVKRGSASIHSSFGEYPSGRGAGSDAAGGSITVRQHEDATLFHRVGEDHWMENARNAHLYGGGSELISMVAEEIEKVLK
jgi:hypothetical protein